MRKNLFKKAMTLACVTLALTANAQEISREKLIESLKTAPTYKMAKKSNVVSGMQKFNTSFSGSKVNTLAEEVKYETPAGIRAWAQVQNLEGWVNFLSFNMKENNYTESSFNYLITPKDSLLAYFDASTATGDLNWAIPGGNPATSSDRDIWVSYPQVGTYDFPTLDISGTQYTAPGKIVVGGKGEIAPADCRVVSSKDGTCSPSYLTFNDGSGSPTGSSSTYNFEGYGNLFILGQKAKISAVNVYINANPTAADPNNKVKMSIYVPGMTQDNMFLFEGDGTPLATAELKVSEMMADAKEVTGLVSSDGKAFMGMASFKLAQPIEVPEMFSIGISNFGNDVEKGDKFYIMHDFLTPSYGESANPVNSISYIYALAQDEQMHWMSMYYNLFEGEGSDKFFPNGNTALLICPVIDYDLTGTGISNVAGEVKNQAYTSNGTLSLSSEVSNEAGIYTVSGQLIQSVSLNDGNQTVSTAGWSKGVYVVKFANGENVKVIL